MDAHVIPGPLSALMQAVCVQNVSGMLCVHGAPTLHAQTNEGSSENVQADPGTHVGILQDGTGAQSAETAVGVSGVYTQPPSATLHVAVSQLFRGLHCLSVRVQLLAVLSDV